MKKRQSCLTCILLILCILLFSACGIPQVSALRTPRHTEPLPPLKTHLLSSLLSEQETIDLAAYEASEDVIRDTYSTLYATDPRLFFLTSEYSISLSPSGNVSYLRPAYRLKEEPRMVAEDDFYSQINTIVAPLAPLSDLEKVTYLHDYMVTRFSYDTTHRIYDAYTLLLEGRGVCQAFALLFDALCSAAGITCVTVPCFEMGHEWNAVKLGDAWYHIDLIWDDTDTDGEVLHTYFLIGDEEMRARRALQDPAWSKHYGWDANFTAPGIRTLSAPWRTLTVPFTIPGDGTLRFFANGNSYQVLQNLSCLSATSSDNIKSTSATVKTPLS